MEEKKKDAYIAYGEGKKTKTKKMESSKNPPPQSAIFRNLIIVWVVYLFSQD